MRRGFLGTLIGLTSVLCLLIPPQQVVAGTPAPARSAKDYGTVRNVLPPGSNGTATVLDVAAVGPSMSADAQTPTNFADQLEMYDDLTTRSPSAIRSADLDRLFKNAGFTPDKVASTSQPAPGVTIQRDSFGVPFITGDTFAMVEFGSGYAAVEDRMFLMDALRHAGQARLAEFAGDSPDNLAVDQAQLRAGFYTREEASAQVLRAANHAGPEQGAKLLTAIDSFLDGVNAAQADMCPTVLAPTCPAEYSMLQKTPAPWTRTDLVYLASLIGGLFGKGGGHEVDNAAWYQTLLTKFGKARARSIYRDLREENDPEAPVTSTIARPYDADPFAPGRPGVALPDQHGPEAPGTGALLEGQTLRRGSPGHRMDLPGGRRIDLSLKHRGMSNALLVSGRESETGKPLAVMGPQTSYFAPQLLSEQVLMGPGIQARGVSFAGLNFYVQLGRGVDYAWSATSTFSDNVDTVVEKLCNVDGTTPTVDSTGYRVGGKCIKMERFTHVETTTPNATSRSAPKTYRFLVLRTRHGLVQSRTTVDGQPVALVAQRSTYLRDFNSLPSFGLFNDPSYVTDARRFQKAASRNDLLFNWFYADNRDIAYYSAGLLPRRSPLVEPDLPHWAGKRFAWKGWLSYEDHPRDLNPKRGYLVSWNNKPAPGFAAADNNWSYGPVHRSLALETRLRRQIAGNRKVAIEDLVGVMSAGATADSRAAGTLPLLLDVVGPDAQTRRARALLRAWVADGAPRVDRDRDGHYAHEQAIAIFDEWWQSGDQSVAYDVMSARLGQKTTRALPQELDDHPRDGEGWFNIAWYSYLNKDLRSVLGRTVQAPYHVGYCGRGSLMRCRADLRESLRNAVARVLARQGVATVEDLSYDKTQDSIHSAEVGVLSVRDIDWQNRPTFQQVVAFDRHRPR